eukprot:6191981-Pleurochrysis_carterae.AAC.10
MRRATACESTPEASLVGRARHLLHRLAVRRVLLTDGVDHIDQPRVVRLHTVQARLEVVAPFLKLGARLDQLLLLALAAVARASAALQQRTLLLGPLQPTRPSALSAVLQR